MQAVFKVRLESLTYVFGEGLPTPPIQIPPRTMAAIALQRMDCVLP